MINISTLLVRQYYLCFWIIYYSSYGCKKQNYGYKRLKNIVISRSSIQIYNIYIINNYLYSTLKLCEKSKNINKVTYLYIVD